MAKRSLKRGLSCSAIFCGFSLFFCLLFNTPLYAEQNLPDRESQISEERDLILIPSLFPIDTASMVRSFVSGKQEGLCKSEQCTTGSQCAAQGGLCLPGGCEDDEGGCCCELPEDTLCPINSVNDPKDLICEVTMCESPQIIGDSLDLYGAECYECKADLQPNCDICETIDVCLEEEKECQETSDCSPGFYCDSTNVCQAILASLSLDVPSTITGSEPQSGSVTVAIDGGDGSSSGTLSVSADGGYLSPVNESISLISGTTSKTLKIGCEASTSEKTITVTAEFSYAGGNLTKSGSASCLPTSSSGAVCGDGEMEGAEECDDGNASVGDGCDDSCKLEVCGNGIVQYGEECDDGNAANDDGCSTACEIEHYCGDGTTDTSEECDDGNVASGDGCSSTCLAEICGDGIIQTGLGEECDDSNVTSEDGCSSTCQNETCSDIDSNYVDAASNCAECASAQINVSGIAGGCYQCADSEQATDSALMAAYGQKGFSCSQITGSGTSCNLGCYAEIALPKACPAGYAAINVPSEIQGACCLCQTYDDSVCSDGTAPKCDLVIDGGIQPVSATPKCSGQVSGVGQVYGEIQVRSGGVCVPVCEECAMGVDCRECEMA